MNIAWDAQGYRERFSFVPRYGAGLMELLTAAPGARVVDLGCGAGALTEKLAGRGYDALGVDASPEMLSAARKAYPNLSFLLADARSFALDRPADAIFSNAVFHWIDASEQDALLANVARNLKPGGELVCEFGGRGCAETVHSALEESFARRGLFLRAGVLLPDGRRIRADARAPRPAGGIRGAV